MKQLVIVFLLAISTSAFSKIWIVDSNPRSNSKDFTTLQTAHDVYNRWAAKIFEVSDYNNTTKVFRGLNESGGELPSGTYFYKIEFPGGKSTLTGYLEIKN